MPVIGQDICVLTRCVFVFILFIFSEQSLNLDPMEAPDSTPI